MPTHEIGFLRKATRAIRSKTFDEPHPETGPHRSQAESLKAFLKSDGGEDALDFLGAIGRRILLGERRNAQSVSVFFLSSRGLFIESPGEGGNIETDQLSTYAAAEAIITQQGGNDVVHWITTEVAKLLAPYLE